MIRIILIGAFLLGSIVVLTAQDKIPADRLLSVVQSQRNQLLDLAASLEARLQIANEELEALRKENEVLKKSRPNGP